jgi:hypothetical protein
MQTQYYQHPTTKEVRGFDPMPEPDAPTVVVSLTTGKKTTTPAPLSQAATLITQAIDGAVAMGFVLMSDADFQAFTTTPAVLTPAQAARAAKFKGVEFEGVLCSAMADDQNGINSVLASYHMSTSTGAAFEPTVFKFVNGSQLTLTHDNVIQFAAVWFAFRASFFTT